ncbi:MAG: B12-binding domain-containing radical SAM protein, partial [Candidatus Taylorbacteria bacterium]|nr:B12-binding domain-containing radical SAM protein [Candidatus Taylorbacteria bacterium]
HATLVPDEAERFADSIMVGYAEPLWQSIVRDAERGHLKKRYVQDKTEPYDYVSPRREIFGERKYLPMGTIETGRGCPCHCNFCSIAAATSSHYYPRPIEGVVADLGAIRRKVVFFVEDNFVGNPKHAKDLCKAITPLKTKWIGQGSLTMAKDDKLLEAMAESGCMGVLIGFESLRPDTLKLMDKEFNVTMGDFKAIIKKIHSFGIALYGTFIFGYDSESAKDIVSTAEKAIEFGLFIGAFNPLIPFPGTPLYEQFQRNDRLTDEAWWLSPSFRFGDVPFNPLNITAKELHEQCIAARKKFYSFPGIIKRAKNISGNCNTLTKAGAFFWLNNLLRKEIRQKDRIPLGDNTFRPTPEGIDRKKGLHELPVQVPAR